MKNQKYTEEELVLLLSYSKSLPEKSYRHFLALQYKRLGHGSQEYISEVFKCCRKTVTKGCKELDSGEVLDYTHQRKQGGGRKKKV